MILLLRLALRRWQRRRRRSRETFWDELYR